MNKWILIVGYGSIGRRHYENVLKLGFDDVRLLRTGPRRQHTFETPSDVITYDSLSSALEAKPWIAIIANPTHLHIDTAKETLRAGVFTILEKPVGVTLDHANELLSEPNAHTHCSMAYCFRYHPLYRTLRDLVQKGTVGRAFHIHAHQASYLPSWHPWENHLESYAARSEMGGGVVRTLDHELDMIRWICGQPIEVMAIVGTLSGIGVNVEDTADMLYRFRDDRQAHVHVCFGRTDYSRGMWVVGEKGTIILDWEKGNVTVAKSNEKEEVKILDSSFDLNTMYCAMLEDAIEQFSKDNPEPAIPITDGVAALEMAVRALDSSAYKKAMPLVMAG